MKKNMKTILPALAFGVVAMTLAACSVDNPVASSVSSGGATPGSSQGSSSWVNPDAEYTITFNPLVEGMEITTKKGKMGATISAPTPEREGYLFSGWSRSYYKSRHNGDRSDISKSIKVTGNAVYYAVWEAGVVHTDEADAYMESLKDTSQDRHLYYHYQRYGSDYNDWDVWCWPFSPTEGQGFKFEWNGRTQDSQNPAAIASGDAIVYDFGGAVCDIDLTKTYNGGWNADTKKIGGTEVSFADTTKVGLQIVETDSRIHGSGFWINDSSNLFVNLDDYAIDLPNGGKAYHVFVVENHIQTPSNYPFAAVKNPFAGDTGDNVTYGVTDTSVDWNSTAKKVKTSDDFLNLGVGYQIMVSSFADSDGDGKGDIYGIYKKLDYLEDLGVKALWLTPIQLSDSYHGYDITDYLMVDPKFGSSVSDASREHGGVVTAATAMEDYRQLCDEAHARGMKIVMDVVLNHTSTSNDWFVASANLEEGARRMYQWGNADKAPTVITEDNNWYKYGKTDYSFYAKFGSGMPELNYSNQNTRDIVYDMAAQWAEFGVDGFRLDAVKHIFMDNEVTPSSNDAIVKDISKTGDYSSNLTKNLHFFRELKKKVYDLSGKNVFFVGENFDGHAYHVAPYYEAFDSMFDFYSYYNLTSAAATGRSGTTSGYGTAGGFMHNTSVYSVEEDKNAGNIRGNLGIFGNGNGSAWNFPGAYNTYGKYRGSTALPGLFTSNHDIARVINRVAGVGTSEGISVQGNINSQSEWQSYEKSADCVKIAELMMPGLTWIYYGDELGMTGNFPSAELAKLQKHKDHPEDIEMFDYADLWYRQPMKWGDDYTTGYSITGTTTTVEWDDANKNWVPSAKDQVGKTGSEYETLKTFARLKSGADGQGMASVLSRGSIEAKNYGNGEESSNVLAFDRVYNGTRVKVAVNFSCHTIGLNSMGGKVLASYGGASQTSMPGYSAIVVKA